MDKLRYARAFRRWRRSLARTDALEVVGVEPRARSNPSSSASSSSSSSSSSSASRRSGARNWSSCIGVDSRSTT